MKYIMIVVFALGVSACGNTMSGFKTDIIEKRQAMADFLSPVETWVPLSSFEKVKEEESE
jgi:predicted small secreted protein|tara:strand:+ start:57 stop:236 length:180 start_codon:yes stop_codon:yes gene_type:complete